MKGFNLSDRLMYLDEEKGFASEDVKEAVKKDFILIWDLHNGHLNWGEFIEKRVEIFGEELLK